MDPLLGLLMALHGRKSLSTDTYYRSHRQCYWVSVLERIKPHWKVRKTFLKLDFDPDFEGSVSHSYKYFMSTYCEESQRISA